MRCLSILFGRLSCQENLKGRTLMLPSGATSQGARKRKHKRRPVWARLALSLAMPVKSWLVFLWLCVAANATQILICERTVPRCSAQDGLPIRQAHYYSCRAGVGKVSGEFFSPAAFWREPCKIRENHCTDH